MQFTRVPFPGLSVKLLPSDLTLVVPQDVEVPEEERYRLAYIPWEEKYLQRVPEEYKDFFLFVLPHVHVRTTDVHVAICLSLLPTLVDRFTTSINQRVVGYALILHDVGWSKVTPVEMAMSFHVPGVTLTKDAMEPKEKHAIEGRKRAETLLATYPFDPPLTESERETILSCVRYHDQPWVVSQQAMHNEVQIVVDCDHLWSFTHENFWQDTVRKNIEPTRYLTNLRNDLDAYFVTDVGKHMAKELLTAREREVQLYTSYT